MTTEKVQTKIPTGIATLIIAAALFGVAGTAAILMNAGVPKVSKKTSTRTTSTTYNAAIFDDALVSENTTPPTVQATCPMFSPLPIKNATTKGIWLSVGEVQALPITGTAATAWNNVCNAAHAASWGLTDLKDQNSAAAGYGVAAALVYAKTGDPALRARVREAIRDAIRSLDEDAEYNNPNATAATNATVLKLVRHVGGWVRAADLIDLPSFPIPSVEPHPHPDDVRLGQFSDGEFTQWLSQIRTRDLPQSNNPNTIKDCNESYAGGGCLRAGDSRIAASLYLGDTADVQRAAQIFQALLGDRSAYASLNPSAPGGVYFLKTGCLDSDWLCDATNWQGVSPACTKTFSGQLVNLDGAIVEQISRQGASTCEPGLSPVWPPVDEPSMMYVWSGLQGIILQAEMLHRQGYPAYEWSNRAMKRIMEFIVQAGWQMKYGGPKYVPWIANYRYRIGYPLGTSSTCQTPINTPLLCTTIAGWEMGWTDWTHAGFAPIPEGGSGCGGLSDPECMPLETQ